VFGLILCPLCLLCCETVFYSLLNYTVQKPRRWNLIWACLICRRHILCLHSVYNILTLYKLLLFGLILCLICSLCWETVFYSLLELGGGGREGGRGRHTCFSTASAVILNWILCEQNWSLASSISEKSSAHHNTKEMAYLCLTCRYCCDFDWQYLCVGHTYAWHLILCEMWKREEQCYCTLSVPATSAAFC
jgi:hypothetical protein